MVATVILLGGFSTVVGWIGVLAFSHYQEKLNKQH